MSNIYFSTIATGDNDGSSWANAYTSLATAYAATANGDTLFLDAPITNPITESLSVFRSNFTIDTNSGPSGVTYWTGGLLSEAVADETGGIYSFARSSQPSYVSYDLKQDDVLGTITGVNLSLPKYYRHIRAFCERTNRDIGDFCAWYGWLKFESATTTPAAGNWSYSGGRVYINAGSGVADVEEKCRYYDRAINGLVLEGSNITVEGKLIGIGFPINTSNAGYAVKGQSGRANTIKDVITVDTGWHAVGFATTTEDNCTIENCIAIGGTTHQPFVFYSPVTLLNAGHEGNDLAFIVTPKFGINGKGIDTESWTPKLGFSHSTGVNLLSGITWARCMHLDFAKQVLNADDEPYLSYGAIAEAQHTGDSPETAGINWTAKGLDCVAVGESACPGARVDWLRCEFDRSGTGANIGAAANSYPVNLSPPSPVHYSLRDCDVATGDYNRAYFWYGNEEKFVQLKDCRFVIQTTDTAKPAVFTMWAYATRNVRVHDSVFQKESGSTFYCVHMDWFSAMNEVPWTTYITHGNTWDCEFGAQRSNGGTAPFTQQQWKDRAPGGSSDTFASPGLTQLATGKIVFDAAASEEAVLSRRAALRQAEIDETRQAALLANTPLLFING